MNTEELLKVLDMSEGEQLIWCAENAGFDMLDATLADLAFRRRDEVCKVSCENYYNALEAVYNYKIKDKQCCSLYAFQTYQIKPIDMIIAAMIALKK